MRTYILCIWVKVVTLTIVVVIFVFLVVLSGIFHGFVFKSSNAACRHISCVVTNTHARDAHAHTSTLYTIDTHKHSLLVEAHTHTYMHNLRKEIHDMWSPVVHFTFQHPSLCLTLDELNAVRCSSFKFRYVVFLTPLRFVHFDSIQFSSFQFALNSVRATWSLVLQVFLSANKQQQQKKKKNNNDNGGKIQKPNFVDSWLFELVDFGVSLSVALRKRLGA